jgi:hypothetical protein
VGRDDRLQLVAPRQLDPRVRTKGYGRRFLQALPFSEGFDPTG